MIRFNSVIENYNRNIRELISKYAQLVKKLQASIRQLEASLRKNDQGKVVFTTVTKESWGKLSLSEKQATYEAASFANNQVKLLRKGLSATKATTTKKYINMVGKNINERMKEQRFNDVKNNLSTIEKFKETVAKHDTKNWELNHNKKEHINMIAKKITKEGFSGHESEAALIVARIYDEVYNEVKQEIENGELERSQSWYEINRRQNARVLEALQKEGSAFIEDLGLLTAL